MASLNGRRIVVGITGGIAAYKGAELVRLLRKEDAEVQVVMTHAAERFITKMTLQTLSGRPVASELFDLDEESQIGHIQIADEAELLLIAPATANAIARLAAGMANDLLTTVALATRAPLLLAPAMNVNMWRHPQTQANLNRLIERGARSVGPDRGDLACGWVGDGRLVDPAAIVEACRSILAPRDLDGVRLLITAGPTQEPLDPVRFLGNRSSGKMGFAIAERAAARGAIVTLIAGPVALATPHGVERVDVGTAIEMRDAVRPRSAGVRCVIMAAAVADFRPKSASPTKLKKGNGEAMTVDLERNPDILAELGANRRDGGPLLVGFAAETDHLESNAREKIERKRCDLLVANDITEAGSGFGTDTNRVTLYGRDGFKEELPLMGKAAVADQLLDRILALLPRSPRGV